MVDHFNKLSPEEAERLAYLIEEMGEALQYAGKVLRHGYESTNPDSNSKYSNRTMLEKELSDVLTTIKLMDDAGDLKPCRSTIKYKWFHHQSTREINET